MSVSESVRGRNHRLYRELLYALESARTRLAVAIAAENKATPREQWLHYLETEDRMRRCVREIRRHTSRSIGRQAGWLEALCLLKQPLPEEDSNSRSAARQLCHRLYDVLAIIENQRELTIDD